jgi:hypothetical protein
MSESVPKPRATVLPLNRSRGPGGRRALVDRINGGDVIAATDSLLELTQCEADVAWLERFLLRQARESSDWNVRELAVTSIGHSARLNGLVASDAVYRELRGFLLDRRLSSRALAALSDIDVFTGRHWTSIQWFLLQVTAMSVRLRAGDMKFWQS